MTAFWTLCAVVCSVIGFTDAVFAGNAGEALVSAALGGFMFVNSVQVLFAAGRRSRPLLDITPPSDTAETAD